MVEGVCAPAVADLCASEGCDTGQPNGEPQAEVGSLAAAPGARGGYTASRFIPIVRVCDASAGEVVCRWRCARRGSTSAEACWETGTVWLS